MNRLNVYAAVIGGGAAGMMCAVRASEHNRGRRIVILEKADRVGKKLLVTGNGRCNLSHLKADYTSYHGEGSSDFINILFEKYSVDTVLSYFRSVGLMTKADNEGRVYPLSNQSSSVLDVLRRRLKEENVDELCGVDIKAIKPYKNGYRIICADSEIVTEKLIVATGGRADYTGKESHSASIFNMLSLRTTPLSPSLSPIKVKNDILRSLKGIRAYASATLIQNGKALKTELGEVQFADSALSGICIFNLSREANLHGGTVSLNLLPDLGFTAVEAEIFTRARRNKTATATDIFTGLFHKNIGLALLKESGIKPSSPCSDISDKELKKIAKNISDWRFTCEKSNDFKKSQVTAGGVKLSEIDLRTLRLKGRDNLYIIGEALDVDGDCGGYNLQFAFASGLCAGDNL